MKPTEICFLVALYIGCAVADLILLIKQFQILRSHIASCELFQLGKQCEYRLCTPIHYQPCVSLVLYGILQILSNNRPTRYNFSKCVLC